MLELVPLIFEDDSALPTPDEVVALNNCLTDNVVALAATGDAESEATAVRMLIKEAGCSLREAIRAVEHIKNLATRP